MSWIEAGIGLLGALGALGGLGSLLTVRASKRRIIAQADETVAGAARVLIGGAADLVEPLRKQLAAASAATTAATARANRLGRKLDALETQLDRVRAWIHDPYMTLEMLRSRVPEPAGTNGARDMTQ